MRLNGKPLESQTFGGSDAKKKAGWIYEANTRAVLVRIPETSQNYEVIVSRGG